MDLVLSDDLSSSELGQSLGRLINAIVAVLGPELSPTSSFFMRCKVHNIIILLSILTTGSYVLDWVIFGSFERSRVFLAMFVFDIFLVIFYSTCSCEG